MQAMNKFTLYIILFLSAAGASQTRCDCNKVISFIQKNIEENSASYQHQVIEKKRFKEYTAFKNEIDSISLVLTTEKECVGLASYYLSFIKDSHQWIKLTNEYYPFEVFTDSVAVKQFIAENVENLPLRDISELKNDIEGKWYYEHGMLEIQIQSNKEKGREYVGLISKPIQYYAKIGDLKLDFYRRKNQLYAVFWDFGQKPKTYPVQLDKGVLKIGREYNFVRNQKDISEADRFKLDDKTYFEEMTDKTNYLKIHSFGYDEKFKIDSILKANHQIIISKENLIIDLRNNSGGSDFSYHPILPYIMDEIRYKKPIKSSLWVSKDNYENLDREKYQYGVNTKKDSIKAEHRMKKLKENIGKFETSNFIKVKMHARYKLPGKVYIITNKNNASSAEGFILTAKQSSKVKIVGEYTAGVMSYGDWRKLEIPDFPAWISITQKKMSFYDSIDFETIGLKPDVILDQEDQSNWKNLTLNLIEQ